MLEAIRKQKPLKMKIKVIKVKDITKEMPPLWLATMHKNKLNENLSSLSLSLNADKL